MELHAQERGFRKNQPCRPLILASSLQDRENRCLSFLPVATVTQSETTKTDGDEPSQEQGEQRHQEAGQSQE